MKLKYFSIKIIKISYFPFFQVVEQLVKGYVGQSIQERTK